jgi:carboxypeptidase T
VNLEAIAIADVETGLVERLNVVVRLVRPEQADARLRAVLARYVSQPSAEGEMRFSVPEDLGCALSQLYEYVDLVPSLEATPPCNKCWEMPSSAGFHEYATLGTAFDKLMELFPGRIQKFPFGRSGEGRELVALRVLPRSGRSRKRVLLVGCHHGAEWISVEITLRIVGSVLDGSAGFPAGGLDEVELWAVPMLNPDGHTFAVECRREWRTSRVAARGQDGILRYGVDLNRNYSVAFGEGGMSSPTPGDDTYSGPRAFSEPETSALRDLCVMQSFDGILSFHAHGREILYPWAHRRPSSSGPEIVPLRNLAMAMAEAISRQGGAYVAKQAWQHYDRAVGGEFCDWAFQTFGKPALTVELGTSDYEMRLPSAQIAATYAEFLSGFSTFVMAL